MYHLNLDFYHLNLVTHHLNHGSKLIKIWTSSDFLQKVVLDTSPWISGETKECCLCIKQYTHIPIYFDYDIFAKNSALNRDLNLFCFIFYFIKNTENVCINCFFYSCNLKFYTPWSRNCHSEALKIRFIKVMCNHIDFQIFVKSGLQIWISTNL